jgi:hypothetical protein
MKTVLQTPLDTLQAMGHYGAEQVRAQHNIQTEASKLAALFQRSPVPQNQSTNEEAIVSPSTT